MIDDRRFIFPALVAFGISFGSAAITQSRAEESIDTYLIRWEQYIDNTTLAKRWQERLKNYFSIQKRWQTYTGSLAAKYPKIVQEQLKELWPEQDLTLDPWGSIDQETNFIPPFDQVRFPVGPAVENYGGKETKARIPSLFRLAELLRIGTNVLKLEAWRIDPSFHAQGNRDFAIVSRARNDIVAIFQHHEAATEIETLRLSVESRLPTGYAVLSMGPDVPLRKFGIEYIDFQKEYMRDFYERRAWDRQQLGSLVAEHALQILPSRAHQREREKAITQLRQAVTTSLQQLQSRLLQHLETSLSSESVSLKIEIEALKNWERASITTPESHHWTAQLISPSGALQPIKSQEITSSPIDFVPQLAQSQSWIAFKALLNGLRRRLPDALQASANERYLAFIIETESAKRRNTDGYPRAQSDY